jgi:hypothetical protein
MPDRLHNKRSRRRTGLVHTHMLNQRLIRQCRHRVHSGALRQCSIRAVCLSHWRHDFGRSSLRRVCPVHMRDGSYHHRHCWRSCPMDFDVHVIGAVLEQLACLLASAVCHFAHFQRCPARHSAGCTAHGFCSDPDGDLPHGILAVRRVRREHVVPALMPGKWPADAIVGRVPTSHLRRVAGREQLGGTFGSLGRLPCISELLVQRWPHHLGHCHWGAIIHHHVPS